MSKKTSGKSSTEQGKGSHKLSDLAARRVGAGEAASVKGGTTGVSGTGGGGGAGKIKLEFHT